ncbi:hypothetical protein HELRODRAFT_173850 [Helobdella robusta]|uniref:Uncharacterized protein n=1 Tax=Helobdella robusta TaxID=6412 RepID=T1F7B0_HELRO|nr:hypothetical protein HELRODRAFT_173850 [Helobdella robusta]ESO03005.1 hypothetical protein HELRODRAFT_173850 [Helobdella robusta]
MYRFRINDPHLIAGTRRSCSIVTVSVARRRSSKRCAGWSLLEPPRLVEVRDDGDSFKKLETCMTTNLCSSFEWTGTQSLDWNEPTSQDELPVEQFRTLMNKILKQFRISIDICIYLYG